MKLSENNIYIGKRKASGITLIALVITIVVLIILATISINAIINDSLTDRAQEAKKEYELKQELERLELIKGQEIIEGLGTVTVDTYVEELIEEGITTNGEVTDNGDGTKTVITDEGYVVLIKPNPDNEEKDIIIEIEGKADKLPVKIEEIELTETSDSIEVRVMVKRGEGATYKYWYREGEGEYKLAHEGKETTYKIEGLKAETRYVIKVEAINENGTVYKEEVGYTGVITPAQGAITFGNLSWSNGKSSVTVTKTTSDNYKIEYQVANSDGTITVEYTEIASGGTIGNLNLGDLVTVRLTDGINHGSTANLNVTDITAPSVTVAKGTVTSNSIQVNVTVADGQAGMPTSPSYKYYIKKSSDANYSEAPTKTQTNASYTFTGLAQNTSYDIKVEVADKAGNVGKGEIKGANTTTVTPAQGVVTFGNLSWSSGKASTKVTKTTSDNYKIQYQVTNSSGTVTVAYTEIASGGTIGNLNLGDLVTVRLTDGINHGSTANLNVTDITAPSVTVAKGTVTSNSIQVNVTAADGQAGMPTSPSYKYYIKKSNDANYSATPTKTQTSTSYTFTGLAQNTQYDIKVEIADKAGNVGKGEIKGTATLVGIYNDKTLPTVPKVTNGMTKVKYDEATSSWKKVTADAEKWYDYSENAKQWANVVLPADEDAKTNLFKADGTLDESKKYVQLVWIPRYAYQITSQYHQAGATAGNINVVFVDTANKGKDGKTYKTSYPTYAIGSGMTDYVVHPAFEYDGKHLTGFWMGKFEASHTGCTTAVATGEATYTGNEILMTKPNVTSWRCIEIGDAFITAQDMNKTGNPYGLNTDDTVVDPHMVKNSEWGAVAYLSKSKYGKQTEEVFINNNSNYITGIAGDTANAVETTSVSNSYKTAKGMKASTTGNATGIYDMSGGNLEMVAAYVNNGHTNLQEHGMGTKQTTRGLTAANTQAKYRDVYTSATTTGSNTQSQDYASAEPNKGKYGDAVWETSGGTGTRGDTYKQSWYSDDSHFPCLRGPFFRRGGDYSNDTSAGVFYFNYGDGNYNSYYSFRVVVPVL